MSRRIVSLSFAFLLAACTTSVLEEEDKQLPENPSAFQAVENPEVDYAQSYISFIGKSNIINHEGVFQTYTVDMDLDDTEPANVEKAAIAVTMDVTSIDTDNGVEGHLQKEDFFHAEMYPEITFTSTEIVRLEGNNYSVMGDLTVKGTTKNIAFDAEITDEYMTLHYDLPRKDFGIGNDSYGAKLLEPLVPIDAKIVFVR